MAVEERREGGGNGFLYFIVGALVIGVAVLAWIMMSGQAPVQDDPMSRVADSVSEAADSISDSARDAADNVTPPAPAPAPAPTPAPAPPTQ
jgi:hypothetical protein